MAEVLFISLMATTAFVILASLYDESKRDNQYKREIWGMAAALVIMTMLALLLTVVEVML